ncbi:hypothetical protein HY638_00770 [Candidatus Woesearchaeota archaeon]|nr:hypothetical protein [Candidatus Woesearchaeota archaeon]
MTAKYKIADFSGGVHFAENGKYTERDFDIARKTLRETYRQTAKLRGIENVDGFIEVSLQALDGVLKEYKTLEEPNVWRKMGPILPQILQDRGEMRREYKFSEKHAKQARGASENYYDLEYVTIGAIFKAEEGIAHLMTGHYEKAEEAFRYPMKNFAVKDVIMRRILALNQALSLAMKGEFGKAYDRLYQTNTKVEQEIHGSRYPEIYNKLGDIIAHNRRLIQQEEKAHEFEMCGVQTFVPLILLEEPIFVIAPIVRDFDKPGYQDRAIVLSDDSEMAGIFVNEPSLRKDPEKAFETTRIVLPPGYDPNTIH